ncbi:hypothetical protein Poli38472_004984 [Pythium oligandrum]|uniref:Uncharacterized protein n=1 Tax=Pythium oligandrum TaxID=41045 RepID=A0A8K1CBT0_PYTOL|nr:hypothetical protein Poli38472_004984 [Pythium oligandrum]|eukprot:TMW59915.1 hypothetical protein Poli38472_004984 [Pythium oligandrum]
MKNPSRERLQADLHLFLTQAVRLELQVNELKEMKRQEQARILEAAAALSALVNLSAPSWQLQVLNEQKKREQAEEERDRLEQLINQQQHVISCLKRLLQQRMDMALPSSPGLPQGNSLWSLYGQFLHDIHVAYLMADEAMEDIDWDSMTQRYSVHEGTARLGEAGVSLELRRLKVIPSPLAQASEKVWLSTSNVIQNSHQVVTEFISTNERVAAQFYHTVCVEGTKSKICVSIVVQHFTEVDREVVVRKFVLTAVAGEEDQRHTTIGEATGWDVLQPLATGETKSRVVIRTTSSSLSTMASGHRSCTNTILIASAQILRQIDQALEQ